MWSRRNMVKAGAASVVAGMASATGFARSPRRDAPNIVFILADDLGVADHVAGSGRQGDGLRVWLHQRVNQPQVR